MGSGIHFYGKRGFSAQRILLMALVVALAIRMFVLDLVVVFGDSMVPAVQPGTVVAVLRCAYGIRLPVTGAYLLRWREPAPGDVVLVESTGAETRRKVKRVFETGPAFINTVSGVLYGRAGQVPVAAANEIRYAGSTYVQPGFVFLVGDNESQSYDSRQYGPVPIEVIGGMVLLYP